MLQARDLKGRRAVSYARWSSDGQTSGDSLRRQTEAAERFCSNHGLILDLKLKDEGVSAFKGANLEASFGKLVADIKAGVIPSDMVLLVENVDRISRVNYLDAQEYFLAVLKTGLTIVTLHDQRVHTIDDYRSNVMLLVMSLMEMQAANAYSAKISERVGSEWSNRANRARQGKVKMSKVPFWIDQQTQQLNARADDARLIFQLAKDGVGQGAITQQLNAKGLPSPKGGQWGKSVVQDIIKSKAAYGSLVVKGDEVRDYYPPLITETEWLSIQHRTRQRVHNPQNGNTATLFPRLVHCGHCGSVMNLTSSKFGEFRYLICSGKTTKRTDCKAPNWRYESFEIEMLSRVGFLAVPIPGDAADASTARVMELADAIGALETRQGNILAGMADASDPASRKFLLDQSATLSSEIEAKRGEMMRLREDIARAEDAETAVDDFELDQEEIERLAKDDRKEAQRLLGNLVSRIDLESDSKTLRRASVTMRNGYTHAIVFAGGGEPG
ncbi:MAG: recombinase family protein [Mesorhizobium sp.]|uniref:recombinase family protein n=1 Tax=Mesorhizobium sp. TaxID=1871066 RepID=UPI000FE53F5F|nr:recombinase family protein [Mesorhizobium sp.]RWB91335.1 MAG: recombinase family protein [Mesorhizobium sp.]